MLALLCRVRASVDRESAIMRTVRSKPKRSDSQSGYFVAAAVFAVLQSVYLFRLIQGDSGTPTALTALVWQLAVVLAFLTVVFLGLILWRGAAIRRENTLEALNPGAIVIPGVRERQLAHAFRSKEVTRADDSAEMFFPIGFSVVADEDGIEFWTGNRTLRLVFRVPWSDVADVSVTDVRGTGKSFRGISIVVTSNESKVELPIVVANRGPAGIFPDTAENLSHTVQLLDVLRRSANAK